MSPPYPLEGVVSWNMNTSCNYRCSYCTQRFLDNRQRWARLVPEFVRGLCDLPGDWEVKLSGGEPTLHPRFLDLVQGLAEGGRRLSLVTNLSAPDETTRRFVELSSGRPGLISASLHLEYSEPESFFERLAALAVLHRGEVHATCVATRELLPRLPALVEQAAAYGLRLKVQPEKQDRDVIAYTEEERLALRRLGGHNGLGLVEPSFLGQPCWAGARYFVMDDQGEAWRCYPARRQRQERLGNLLDGSLRRGLEATPCRYDYCNCTVPPQRAMVRGGGERDTTGA